MRLTSDHSSPGSDALLKRRLPPERAWVMVVGALIVVFVLDRRASAAPVQHLYYLPIIIASVRFGYRWSLSVAAAAILLYHLANPQVLTFRYEESDLVQMALFVAVGVISAKLADDAQRLHLLAITDDLTGLHNLRSFESRLRALVRASRQTAAPLALLVLDVDRLKSLNDTHGHLAGAEAVRTIGHVIGRSLPPEAVACRYGGDEFAIAIPNRSETQAVNIADDLRCAVNACAPVLAGAPFPAGTLSISVGIGCRTFERSVVGRDAPGESAADDAAGEGLFRAADAALYYAKAGGRNRLSVAQPTVNSRNSTT